MKFSRHLATHLTPEWYPQYINYSRMKKILYKVVRQVDYGTINEIARLENAGTTMFLAYCQRELVKIQGFYTEKISEAQRKLITLTDEIGISNTDELVFPSLSESPSAAKSEASNALLHITSDKRKLRALKMAFSELYLLLVLIQNYQNLNCTGFRKILKKHDKLYKTNLGGQWNREHVLVSNFSVDKTAEQLIEQVENIFTVYLEKGNRSAAMKVLRVPPLDQPIEPVTSFRLGILVGMTIVLFPVIALSINWIYKEIPNVPWQAATQLYRSVFLIILQLCLTGINLLGWSKSGVNHVLIFELDPRQHLNYQQLLEVGLFLLLLWQLSIFGFLICSYVNKYSLLNPLILCAVLFIIVTNPSRFLYWSARRWLIRSFAQVFLPCMQSVEFRHFWLGDQLTSQGLVFYDVFHFISFYAFQYSWKKSNADQSILIRPNLENTTFFLIFASIFSLLPHLARFSQCIRRYNDDKMWFPHLLNAGKYLSSFPVVIMNTLRPKVVESGNPSAINRYTCAFTGFAFIESSYKLTWDLKMDWGLLDKTYSFVRESTVYGPPIIYYIAILQDCILRFAWILKIILRKKLFVESIYFEICFSIIEIIRRFIWNFFRLENEHLNNCGNFRAVRDISIHPIRQSIVDKNNKNSKNSLDVNNNNESSSNLCVEVSECVGDDDQSKLIAENDKV
ncbi:hypothetical protein GJ496_003589 [Pomphorhynchus laevis]|nr:hypothetical protein GJ496_003589 [Pomphorhynchus laevis]